jgi:hypothetical protein
MHRLSIALVTSAFALPLYAHDGMSLHSPLHRALHTLGTDTVIALCGLPLAIVAAVVLRRLWRARTRVERANDRAR